MIKKYPEFDFSKILIVLFSCFFVAEGFFQKYNENTWIFMMFLTVGLCGLIFFKKNIILPDKRLLYFLGFAFTLTALQSLMNDSHLLEERWVLRYMTLIFIFVLLQFKTEEKNFNLLAWPFLLFIFGLSSWSVAQYLFEFDLYSRWSLSTFGSRFWNISYYAQAMIIALPFLSYFKTKNKSSLFAVVFYTTALFIFLTLFASHSRASLISLALFITMELFKPAGFTRKNLIVLLAAGFLLNAVVWQMKTAGTDPMTSGKQLSFQIRKNLLDISFEMAKDFPAGVGPDRFRSVLYLYYDKDKPLGSQVVDITKTPHNEFLQVLTEDGWGIFAIYTVTALAALLFSLRHLLKKEKSDLIFPKFFICCFPQILFHFPFDLYFPVFLLALAFAQLIASKTIQAPASKFFKLALMTIAITLTFTITIREKKILSNQYASTYCEIFHDNLSICKKYFEEAYAANDFTKAEAISRALVRYQPFFYATLGMDYALGVEPRSQIIACLYYDLFNGEHSIFDSKVDKCPLSHSREKKIELFSEFVERR